MIVYYFGADAPWNGSDDKNIRRRNMAILVAIAKIEFVSKVYNVIRTQRKTLSKKPKSQSFKSSKIENIFIAPILPERGFLKFLRPLNVIILKHLNRHIFKEVKNKKQLAWCYWPRGYDDFKLLNLSVDMVFDTDHNIIDDPNVEDDQKEIRERQLIEIGKSSRIIVSSSRSMLCWYRTKGFSKTNLILNGIFESRINLKPTNNSDHSYKVTYCGTLSKWMKLDWLVRIIDEKPDWIFTFIGESYKTDISQRLMEYPNVILLGFLPPKKADVIIKQSNVCFGLYERNEALDVNSMKLYDYLAQGVPVVVNNYHLHLNEDFEGLLNVAKTYEDFKFFLENPNPIDVKVLQSFLDNSTWSKRIQTLISQFNA